MKKSILFLGLCFFFSCNTDTDLILEKESNNGLQVHQNVIITDELKGGIKIEKTTLTDTDALKVAKLFNSQSVETRSGSQKSIKQLMSITDDAGEPLMYVVNFEDNQGYVIISATKNQPAVLAYSHEGNFDDSYFNTGMSTYIDEFKCQIKEVINKDIDSLRVKYALSWFLYENVEDDIATYSAASEKRAAEVAKWESKGYSCMPLSSLSLYIGSREAQDLINSIRNVADLNYDLATTAIVLLGQKKSEKVGPLLQTSWHQGIPFNVDASNGYAGCWPIAIAQLMKYHEHPKTYNWRSIPIYPEDNPGFNYFIKDIRNKCKAEYDDDGTGASTNNAVSALNKYFQYNAKFYNYSGISSYNSIRASLKNRNPVLMRGYRYSKEDDKKFGHAWVTHGYDEFYSDVKVAFITDMYQSGEYTTIKTGEHHWIIPYLNMNWGWGRNSDYVYYYSTSPTGSTRNYKYYKGYVLVTKK